VGAAFAEEAAMAADRGREGADGGESARPDSHRLYSQQIIQFALDGHMVTDSQGVILEANYAAATMLRCPKEFLIGKPLGLFVAPGHRHRFYQCLARLHGEGATDKFETRMSRRGDPRDVAIWASAVDDGADGETIFRWLIRDITDRRQAEAARAELVRRLVTAQEDERRRVARELHDSVGQLLSALLLGIRSVRDVAALPPLALNRLNEVQRLAEALGEAAHDLAVRLRPTALDDVGLLAALQHDLEEWSARTGIEVQFQAVGTGTGRFPPEVETALYRIAQEALTNILRHAHAQVVAVVVERQNDHAIVVVEDNGVGFDVEGVLASGRLGLLGMRERAVLVGGTLEIESQPGVGTTVIARVPLQVNENSESL
jgi:PAS domain S-box-containing protein